MSAKRTAVTTGSSSAPPGGAKRQAPDKEMMVCVDDRMWKDQKESEMFDYFGLLLNSDLYDGKGKLPSWTDIRLPGNGVYECRCPAKPGTTGTSTCGAWIATSTRNKGVARHLDDKHPEMHVVRLANPADSRPSDYAQTISVLRSGLPYSPFADPAGPLRRSKVVPRFPSAPTVRRHAQEVVLGAQERIKNYLKDEIVHVTTDFTPTKDKREMAVVNVHCWKKGEEPCTITLGVIEFEGSATAQEVTAMLDKVLDTYGVVSVRRGGTPGALQLGACSDSGANAAKASREMAEPAAVVSDRTMPDFNGWCACVAHSANLLIKDALGHQLVKPLIVSLMGMVKAVRASRATMEAIKAVGIKAPGRFVASRWRSMLGLIEYFLRNAGKLASAHAGLAIPHRDLLALRVVHAVLKPLDIIIAHAQADRAGAPLLLSFRLQKALTAIKTLTGLRVVVLNDAKETEPLLADELGADLLAWKRFLAERFQERFFSLETADFEDVVGEDDASASSDDEESDDEMSDDEMSDEDDADDSTRPSNWPGGGTSGRFRRYNILMNSFVLASYALSPLCSAWEVALAERALEGDDPAGIAKEDAADGMQHLLHIRYMTDRDYMKAVDDFRAGTSASRARTEPRGALALLRTGSSSVRDPVADTRGAVERFRARQDVNDLFSDYLAKFSEPPPDQENPPDQKKDENKVLAYRCPTVGDDIDLVTEWEKLAKSEPPFVGALLRVVLSAPMTSTKCESDFSLLQHLLESRRLRMSRVMLAAYMFCKKASQFVPDSLEARTRQGQLRIDSMLKFKSSVAGPLKPLGGAGRSAETEAAASSSSAGSGPATVGSDSDSDDSSDEEPELARALVTTRSGRTAGTFRTAADVAKRVIVSQVTRGRGSVAAI